MLTLTLTLLLKTMLQVWKDEIIIYKKMLYVPEFHPQNSESESQNF